VIESNVVVSIPTGILTVEGAEHILKTNFENYVKGQELHDILSELLGNGIFVSDGQAWQGDKAAAAVSIIGW
jgi:hypothetical protein